MLEVFFTSAHISCIVQIEHFFVISGAHWATVMTAHSDNSCVQICCVILCVICIFEKGIKLVHMICSYLLSFTIDNEASGSDS